MAGRSEVLVMGCREDDLAVLRSASGPNGPLLLTVDGAADLAEHAIRRHPAAVIIGVGTLTLHHLDLIPVLRAARQDLPVIVIAEDDSLEVERSARQKTIFYYLVHPLERAEVEAVLRDAMRCARS
jgi:DNA-binding NtrC family response regulator